MLKIHGKYIGPPESDLLEIISEVTGKSPEELIENKLVVIIYENDDFSVKVKMEKEIFDALNAQYHLTDM